MIKEFKYNNVVGKIVFYRNHNGFPFKANYWWNIVIGAPLLRDDHGKRLDYSFLCDFKVTENTEIHNGDEGTIIIPKDDEFAVSINTAIVNSEIHVESLCLLDDVEHDETKENIINLVKDYIINTVNNTSIDDWINEHIKFCQDSLLNEFIEKIKHASDECENALRQYKNTINHA